MIRPARIVFLIDGLGMGGAERLMVPVLQHLDRARFEPRVCALQIRQGNPMADQLRDLDVPVDQVPVRRLRDITALPRIARYLRAHRADLVHTQLEFSNTLGCLAAKLNRIPSLSTLHSLDMPKERSKYAFRLKLMYWSLRRNADRVLAVSEQARQHYLAASGDRPEHAVTLYNGISVASYAALDQAERAAARRSLGIAEDAQVLITVAVLREMKGIQYMIRALPTLLQTVPNATYLVVGDGDHRAALEAEAAAQGVEGHVIFAGMRADVPELLSAADVFVLPTLTEALPTVLAEAMAARLPLVASAVGGVPEMIEDRQNGLLLPPADPDALAKACAAVLSDPSFARRIAEAGHAVVEEKFNIQRQVQRLEAVYNEVLAAYTRG